MLLLEYNFRLSQDVNMHMLCHSLVLLNCMSLKFDHLINDTFNTFLLTVISASEIFL